MPASIEAAKAGVTTGEWGAALRAEFGEYRAPTGVARRARQEAADLDSLARRGRARIPEARPPLEVPGRQARPRRPFQRRRTDRGARHRRRHGRRLRRHSPDARGDRRARQDRASHCVGLSILSGSHLAMTHEVAGADAAAGLGHVPVIVGGIIPPDDAEKLRAEGVAAVYTPKDFAINEHHRRHRRAGRARVRGAGAGGWMRAGLRRGRGGERGWPRAPRRGRQDWPRGARGDCRSERIAAQAAAERTGAARFSGSMIYFQRLA